MAAAFSEVPQIVVQSSPAEISAIYFSPDKSKLVYGDVRGRVFVLDGTGSPPEMYTELPGEILTLAWSDRRRSMRLWKNSIGDMAAGDATGWVSMVGFLDGSKRPTLLTSSTLAHLLASVGKWLVIKVPSSHYWYRSYDTEHWYPGYRQ